VLRAASNPTASTTRRSGSAAWATTCVAIPRAGAVCGRGSRRALVS
jgi:hypothetical protein